MKKTIILLLFFPLFIAAQVQDDFLDGEFISNPAWYGDSLQFQISTYSNSSWSVAPRLQLNGTVSDTSFLYIVSPMLSLNNRQWDFWVHLSFNTSKSNNCRIYLVSDNSDLESSLNGYFVMLGDDNNDQLDSVSLWKQTGLATQKIISGSNCFTGATSSYRIKVERDNFGNWFLFADATGSTNYVLEGTVFDTTYTSSSFFGIYCKYTSSNKTNFYFDDFYAGPKIVDTTPPIVQSVTVVSATELDVVFSENVDEISAENLNNYFVSGVGIPLSASKDINSGSIIRLVFSVPFSFGNLYAITIANVKDIGGNTMISCSVPFSYYFAHSFDIVINEIMADPNPTVGLPNFEYLELYNNTQYPINMNNWRLEINSTHLFMPDMTILPNCYFIICDVDAIATLNPYGTTIGFSSFSLTNTGATIVLKDAMGNIIHFVNYSDLWYQSPTKTDGGWSLEQIDPNNPCGEMANWKASNDPSGGTPGKINSLFGNNPDIVNPELVRASVSRYEPMQVKIFYNETLDSSSINYPEKYVVENGAVNPIWVQYNYPDKKSAVLYFSQAFLTHTIYTLTIIDSIFDCSGNKIAKNSTVRFALPELPDSGDLVINEVLSNPKDNGVDFVEIYNRSDKVLDFMDLNLGSLSDIRSITTDNFLIFPGDYIVLTSNPEKVKAQYLTPNPFGFICMESFPSYTNDEGTVILITKTDTVIDAMTYNADMNFPLLNSDEGVSLERIDYNRSASDITNWHSAAETVGFATPAYKNSQFSQGFTDDGTISVNPEIFSPDNDGYNDVLHVCCKIDGPGKIINLFIYDSKGRLIKGLVKNKLISEETIFSWDGTTENNTKATIGIYIIYAEVFDLDGSVKHYKRTAVLATKL
ncbi:MAG: lamin tail domain-containing protein [Bacteroidota bacterium]